MSGSVVQTAAQFLNNGSAGTSWSVSLGSAVGPGNAIVVSFGNLQAGSAGLSVTDNQGNIYTVTNFGTNGAGGGYESGLAYALNITNAPTAIILEAPSISYPQMVIAEVSGIYGLDASGFQTNTSTTTPSSPSVTTTLPNDFVIGFIVTGSGATTATAGSGFTQIGPASTVTNFIMEYQTTATAGSAAAQFNLNAADISGAGIAAFKTSITVISDITMPLEFSGALVTIVSDAEIQIETLASQAPPPLWIEWLATAAADAAKATEIAASPQRDAPIAAEWLGATLIVADAMLPLEIGQARAVALWSLETGPGRIRLLTTPGRVRLIRRS
ncbi:MAG: hypothetical protein ACREE2_00965 [Stellaceae bacterium]